MFLTDLFAKIHSFRIDLLYIRKGSRNALDFIKLNLET